MNAHSELIKIAAEIVGCKNMPSSIYADSITPVASNKPVERDRAICPDLKCGLYPEFCQRDKCTLEKKPPGPSL